MLWGLACASARPLPAVIDTPMARLDAAHRRHLVERDFPNASHPVLILSTDTEVDRHDYQLLQHVSLATTNGDANVDLEMKANALANGDVGGDEGGVPWKEDVGLMEFLRKL